MTKHDHHQNCCEHKNLQDSILSEDVLPVLSRYDPTPLPYVYMVRSCADCGKEIKKWKVYTNSLLHACDEMEEVPCR
jgi:hypothetical protein